MQHRNVIVTALAVSALLLAVLSTVTVRSGITFDVSSVAFAPRKAHPSKSIPNTSYQLTDDDSFSDSKVAFATFLSAFNASDFNPEGGDGYFDSARLINYQLLHHPFTRSSSPVPFIVLVSPNVTDEKRKQLRHEGATVVEGKDLTPAWLKEVLVGNSARWIDVMTKLNIASMTQFEKICFIDADTMIRKPIDGIFNDPATEIIPTGRKRNEIDEKEAPLPDRYMFAAMLDRHTTKHPIPPSEQDWDDRGINAGFFCLHPSQAIFDYYLSVIIRQDKYFASFPEQNMLNVVHRRRGNMPWTHLQWDWNTNHPSPRDIAANVKSLHGKLWLREDQIMSETLFPQLRQLWWDQKHEMDAFYAAPDYRNGTGPTKP